VAGLVLENPGGLAPVDDPAARAVLGGLARAFEAGARGAWWFPAFFAVYYRMVLRGAPAAAQRARIVAAARDVAPTLAQAWRSFAVPDADLRPLVPRVRCPTLFAWATQDRLVALARSLPAIRAFPNARLERFRAGHSPHLETPDALAEAVEAFLARLDGPTAA
jgi:4,5:9,10-diseco-3-hydroxy-5,9,17-trioxoandrosta-1(10),2-diene-4-oate hydrolase